MIIDIKITDFDKFSKRVNGDEKSNFTNGVVDVTFNDVVENKMLIFSKSHVKHIRDNDNRDDIIDELLDDRYEMHLDPSDIDTFIDMVEKDNSIICDLTIDNKEIKFLKNRICEIKEIQKYTEGYIRDNPDKDYKFLNPNTISKLPLNIFELYPDNFNWDIISYLELSKNFIETNKDRLNWEILSVHLDEKYYTEFSDYLIMHEIIELNLPINIKREVNINGLLE